MPRRNQQTKAVGIRVPKCRNPKGASNPVTKKPSRQTVIKLTQIARFSLQGYRQTEIAKFMGYTNSQGVPQLIHNNRPTYNAIKQGIASELSDRTVIVENSLYELALPTRTIPYLDHQTGNVDEASIENAPSDRIKAASAYLRLVEERATRCDVTISRGDENWERIERLTRQLKQLESTSDDTNA